jgi:hypothetical protein
MTGPCRELPIPLMLIRNHELLTVNVALHGDPVAGPWC